MVLDWFPKLIMCLRTLLLGYVDHEATLVVASEMGIPFHLVQLSTAHCFPRQ